MFCLPPSRTPRARLTALGLGCVFLLASCRTLSGPEEAGHAYARALREGRLDEAYEMTSVDYRRRVSADTFQKRYQDEIARNERANSVEAALVQLKAQAPELFFIREGEAWKIEDPVPDTSGPSLALEQFVEAVERGDFVAAYDLLSASWRARYSPDRLKEDFDREPLARERLDRAKRALGGHALFKEQTAEYPLGDGKAVRLVREGGAYKISALE